MLARITFYSSACCCHDGQVYDELSRSFCGNDGQNYIEFVLSCCAMSARISGATQSSSSCARFGQKYSLHGGCAWVIVQVHSGCIGQLLQFSPCRLLTRSANLIIKVSKEFTNSTNEMQLNFNSLLSLIIRFADFHNMQIVG